MSNTFVQKCARSVVILLLAFIWNVASDDPPQSGQLTAGEIDDNLNFESFISYKESALLASVGESQSQESILPSPDLSNRIPIRVLDSNGAPFSCAVVEVRDDQEQLKLQIPTGTNGRLSLFPSIDGLLGGESSSSNSYTVVAKAPEGACPCSEVADLAREDFVNNAYVPTLSINVPSVSSSPPQLDVAFVVDTTGSMCDELAYLQSELKAVVARVISEYGGNVDVRVGIVAYRDHGDAYLVRPTPLSSPDVAIAALADETWGGGGDFPEAMDEAIESASSFDWRSGNVARVLFLVADAPPHNENLERTLSSALDLRTRGVRVYGIAASGVADTAEYMMRLMAFVTGARYAWLTDDSGIGNPHAEPKVVCYQVTRLDQLLVRVLGSELTGQRVEANSGDIIREVGNQTGGVCIVDVDPAEAEESQSPTASPTASPVGPGAGDEGFGDDVGPEGPPLVGGGDVYSSADTRGAPGEWSGANEAVVPSRIGALLGVLCVFLFVAF